MYLSLTLSADVTFEVDFVKVEFLENKNLVISGPKLANNKDPCEILCLSVYISLLWSGNYMLRSRTWLACWLKIARPQKSRFDHQLSQTESLLQRDSAVFCRMWLEFLVFVQ